MFQAVVEDWQLPDHVLELALSNSHSVSQPLSFGDQASFVPVFTLVERSSGSSQRSTITIT